ncbi:MAG: methylenetetrahydromethanopterin dehydrogenase, partial [Planctomycetota bacterium]|nr:methylenetetrahydromethanopterin dehydrogenase [Planctomycetota bacterium]
MTDKKILVQIDTDPQPSVFDSVVAIDADVDQLLRHANVEPDQVRDLVYGAMFTRGPSDLKNTAIFVGGSDVSAGEDVFAEVQRCYFDHIRVSCMIDSNGSNTTAAAAVLAARRHMALGTAKALVLAATGPVGARVTRLLAGGEAQVRAASRTLARAEALSDQVKSQIDGAAVEAVQ